MNATANAEALIPTTVAEVGYFLSGINSPGWHWAIRVALAGAFVAVLLVYIRYRKALDSDE